MVGAGFFIWKAYAAAVTPAGEPHTGIACRYSRHPSYPSQGVTWAEAVLASVARVFLLFTISLWFLITALWMERKKSA